MSRFSIMLLSMLIVACSSLPKTQREILGATDWVSFDGKTMPYKTWAAPAGQKPRGIIIAIHGLSGAASDFWYLGEQMPTKGYTVYAYELRGQGNDPIIANRGDIPSAEIWQHDLSVFHRLIKRRHPHTPIFWYGESLGSLIALHTAASKPRWSDPDAIILATPIAGLRQSMTGFQRVMLETLATLSPRTRFSLGELAGVDESKIQVTSGTTHGGQMAKTPHHVENFSLRLLTAIGAMLDRNTQAARKLQMPVLFLGSPNDIISSADQIQHLFSQLSSDQKKLLWYTRSYHLLLHDVQRQEVVHDLAAWLRSKA